MTNNGKRIEGVQVLLSTPMLESGELDYPSTERLIEHVIRGGVHGLFVLGTSGEAPSLSYRLRRELIAHACRIAAGRVPVRWACRSVCCPSCRFRWY